MIKDTAKRIALDALRKRSEKSADEAKARLDKAFQIEEISSSHAKYMSALFSSAMKGTGDESVQNALLSYQNALKKHGFCEDDFKAKPYCEKCDDKGISGGKLCDCVFDEYVKSLSSLLEIEKRAPFSFEDNNLKVVQDETQRKELKKVYAYMQAYADKLPDVKLQTVLLSGGVGTGKSSIASAVARRTVERGLECMFLSAYEFNSKMLVCHTSPAKEKYAALEDVLGCDLLVIDDLGVEPMLKNVTVEYLLLVLDERRRAGLCTIVTTNLSADRIMYRYGERVYSRLCGKTQSLYVELSGKDLRLGK